MADEPPPVIVVMGVQGCGKSTLGALLAERLAVPFVDGDALHSENNIALMAAGIPLTDTDRLPWLRAVGETLSSGAGTGIVVVCSALKRSYRDLLRSYVPGVVVVHPYGPIELVAARISAREHEYMPPSLLTSQYDALEALREDEAGMTVDIAFPPTVLVDRIADSLTESRGHAHQQD
ncbi:gluconokinase [Arthrobacter sp. Br18]|uniref:gluconokinase n=1 Tax=Arthrobacter sp. Br18 TaxID=1312954 RepID=UPI000478EB35|nr:gluconokinase [Arthrobacter sp. Br18]